MRGTFKRLQSESCVDFRVSDRRKEASRGKKYLTQRAERVYKPEHQIQRRQRAVTRRERDQRMRGRRVRLSEIARLVRTLLYGIIIANVLFNPARYGRVR